MKTLKEKQKIWFGWNATVGRSPGYPECCIKAFCDQPPSVLKHTNPSKDDIRRYKAGCIDGGFTGFIPCAFHAREIVMGRITLKSLIKDRDKTFPDFPENPDNMPNQGLTI